MSFPVTYLFPFSVKTLGSLPSNPVAAKICEASSIGIFLSLFVSKKPPDMMSCIPPIIAPPNLGDKMFSCTFINMSHH